MQSDFDQDMRAVEEAGVALSNEARSTASDIALAVAQQAREMQAQMSKGLIDPVPVAPTADALAAGEAAVQRAAAAAEAAMEAAVNASEMYTRQAMKAADQYANAKIPGA